MAETVGWLTDKVIISELKIYHMLEQINREGVDESHRKMCRLKLNVLRLQRDDLKHELSLLVKDILNKKVKPKLYRQFKMYNDPRYGISKARP